MKSYSDYNRGWGDGYYADSTPPKDASKMYLAGYKHGQDDRKTDYHIVNPGERPTEMSG